MSLFRRRKKDTGSDKYAEELLDAIRAMASAQSWADRKRVVKARQDVLLTGVAEYILGKMIDECGSDQPDAVRALSKARDLLARCRSEGIDAAFAQHMGNRQSTVERVFRAIDEFVNADTWEESKQVVEANRDLLLSDYADAAFIWLIMQYDDNPAIVRALKEHRELLARCRREGIDAAFAERLRSASLSEDSLRMLAEILGMDKDKVLQLTLERPKEEITSADDVAPCTTTILEDLFDPDRKYCFLAGSGISIDPPSCLPTGYQFTKTLIERLIPEAERTNVLALMNPKREGMRNPGDFLRFEELMEYLQRSIDPELRVLNGYAACRTANFSHVFLAEMLTQDHPLLTTNFDNLIEYALLETGVAPEFVFPVIHQQDWEAQPRRKQHRVYKLHGSLVDIRNARNCRESLQATLEQIAQGKSEMFQLEPWKRRVLESLLQNHDLVVLGYSGLDDFDVLPTLWGIPSDRLIIWISHEEGLSFAQASIERFDENASSTRSKRSSQPDRVAQFLMTFARFRSRQLSQLVRINVDTGQLLEWLWERYVDRRLPVIKSEFAPEEFRVPELGLSEADQWILTGQIYHDRNLLCESLQAYQAAFVRAKHEGMQDRMGESLQGMGHVFGKLGRREEASKCHQQLLAVAEQSKDLKLKAIALNEIATSHLNQGRFTEALESYQEALAVAEQVEDQRWKARTLNNLGLLHNNLGRFAEAQEAYQQAIAINEQLGDLRAKSTNLHNIGILHASQGCFAEAKEAYQQAIAIADQLGALEKKVSGLDHIAQTLKSQGRTDEALEYYQQALVIGRQLEMPILRAGPLASTAALLYQQRRIDEALECCEEALALFEQLDEPHHEAILLNLIGVIFHNKRRFPDSLEAFQKALAIHEELARPVLKCTTLSNFAFLLYDMGQTDKALETLGQAREIADQLKHPDLSMTVQQVQLLILMGR